MFLRASNLLNLLDDDVFTKYEYESSDYRFHEDKDNYYVMYEMPGVKKEDISISYEKNTISVSGKKESFGKYKSTYKKSFKLIDNLDPSKFKALYENGELVITIPKLEISKAYQIELK